jgi:glycosyltransferase involved in cell wall biosynthesis
MTAASGQSGRLQVTALVPYHPGTTPSQRFRIEQWMPHLAAVGIDVDLLPFAGPELTALLLRPGRTARKAALTVAAFARAIRGAARVPAGSLLLVHRAACLAGPPVIERVLHRRGHRMVYDFDDAIFRLHTAAANRLFARLKTPGKTAVLCRISDHVVVCNSFLADYARSFNDRVSIVASSVDTDRSQPRPRSPNPQLVVGWMGSSTSQTYLEAAAGMLREVMRARPVQLRVVSNRRPELPGVEHTWREWSADTEADELAAFDIGIMPMPDDAWARGKCAFKALQYMGMGVATVAEAAGANREVIRPGHDGLLAASPGEWLECITTLVDNPDLRRQLGMAGRRTVEERYSMRVSAAKFEGVLRGVAARRRDDR